MVPQAVRAIGRCLTALLHQPPRMKAVEMVFKMAGVEQVSREESDKSELQNFLLGKGVNIEQVNVQLPPSHPACGKDARFSAAEIVEGEVVEHEDADPYDEPD